MPKFLLDAINLSGSVASILSFPAVAIPLFLGLILPTARIKRWRRLIVILLVLGFAAYVVDLSDRFDFPLPWSRIVPKQSALAHLSAQQMNAFRQTATMGGENFQRHVSIVAEDSAIESARAIYDLFASAGWILEDHGGGTFIGTPKG
jgi:hypothetical protein